MADKSKLEVLLEFIGRPLVWVTIVAAVLLYLIGNGTLDVALLEQVLGVLGRFFSQLKFW